MTEAFDAQFDDIDRAVCRYHEYRALRSQQNGLRGRGYNNYNSNSNSIIGTGTRTNMNSAGRQNGGGRGGRKGTAAAGGAGGANVANVGVPSATSGHHQFKAQPFVEQYQQIQAATAILNKLLEAQQQQPQQQQLCYPHGKNMTPSPVAYTPPLPAALQMQLTASTSASSPTLSAAGSVSAPVSGPVSLASSFFDLQQQQEAQTPASPASTGFLHGFSSFNSNTNTNSGNGTPGTPGTGTGAGNNASTSTNGSFSVSALGSSTSHSGLFNKTTSWGNDMSVWG